jgi:hypothetical protein
MHPFLLRDKICGESQFLSMENNIRLDLRSNIGPIRRKNCIESVQRETLVFSDGLKAIKQDLDKKLLSNQRRIDALNSFKTRFKNLLREELSSINLPTTDEVILESGIHFIRQTYVKILHNRYDFGFKNEGKYSSSDLKKIISDTENELLDQLKNDIAKITLDDFSLSLQKRGERTSNIAKYILDTFRDFVLRLHSSGRIEYDPSFSMKDAEILIRDITESLQLPQLSASFHVAVSSFGNINVEIKKLDSLTNLLWEMKKRSSQEARTVYMDYFDPNTEKGPLAEIISKTETAIQEEMVKWIREIAIQKLYADFMEKMESDIQNQLRQADSDQTAMLKDSKNIVSMLNNCSNLYNQMKVF